VLRSVSMVSILVSVVAEYELKSEMAKFKDVKPVT
jgi:hypothetical protein